MKPERHHYIPEWYQRRFIPKGAKDNNLWILDKAPDRIAHPGGFHYAPELRRRGPDVSFCEEDLYTLHFGKTASNFVERRFFGEIDRLGSVAIAGMAEFEFGKSSGDHFKQALRYLDAQKLRTPKALELLKAVTRAADHETAVRWMGRLSQVHSTIWCESIWEVFKCDHTPTKLIFSDHPVTSYNRLLSPSAPECRYPYDPEVSLLGTQTLFPLCPERLLVITNLGFARNHFANQKAERINARSFDDSIIFLGNIHSGRKLNEGEVRAVNYIIKERARKFIAAGEEEWLYPEHTVKTKVWRELGGEFFLRPDPRRVGFSGEIYVGWKDGSSWGKDEYGRMPRDDNERKRERSLEWTDYTRSTDLWDKKLGPAPKSAKGGSFI